MMCMCGAELFVLCREAFSLSCNAVCECVFACVLCVRTIEIFPFDCGLMVGSFPLACGYNGAIAIHTWRALMDRLGIHPTAQDRVLKLAARAICIGVSTMVDISRGCLKATEVSDQPG